MWMNHQRSKHNSKSKFRFQEFSSNFWNKIDSRFIKVHSQNQDIKPIRISIAGPMSNKDGEDSSKEKMTFEDTVF